VRGMPLRMRDLLGSFLHRIEAIARAWNERRKSSSARASQPGHRNTPSIPSPSDIDDLYASGIFVVGHARSGTTVLQMALNTSPDIFMFGEAYLHLHHAKPGFAAWYRAMHAQFKNPPGKDSYCPDFGAPDADGWATLGALRRRYRLVGDKLAFRHRSLGYDPTSSFKFLADHFLGSYFLCTLRNPNDVLWSNQTMFEPSAIDNYIVSYLECLSHELDIFFLFDRSVFVTYEDIEPQTFEVLGKWLGCDLGQAFSCYNEDRLASRHPAPIGADPALLQLAVTYYTRLRRLIDPSTLTCTSRFALDKLHRELAADVARLTEASCPVRSIADPQAQSAGPVRRLLPLCDKVGSLSAFMKKAWRLVWMMPSEMRPALRANRNDP